MKFKKIIVWMLMLAMILNLPASTLAATSPVAPCKNHRWGEWDPIEDPTCTTTGKQIRYCEVCFTEQIGTIPKLPHSWDGWTVTKEPTCTSTGSRFHTCTVCGTRETETMDKAMGRYYSRHLFLQGLPLPDLRHLRLSADPRQRSPAPYLG